MKRKHSTYLTTLAAAKLALVAILVPFLLAGGVTLDKARQIFDTASQVCRLIDGTQECVQN
ncbi:hypothetical protein RVX82_001009 [Citrobacter braakii]|nr:hypothetical protein [Citrobacter braakii]